MNEENKQSPNSFLDNSSWRQKSTIDTNFNYCRYMLDSEMNICYISTIKHGRKNALCTINIDKKNKTFQLVPEK